MKRQNMKRICGNCKENKDLILFPKNKNKKLGYGHTCKICLKSIIDESNRTMSGVIRSIYNGQKRSSKYRNMEEPNYNKEHLEIWLYKNNFKEIYDNWVNNDYLKDYKPSVDRIDDYKPYTIDNIQLMTWRENRDKCHRDKINGINNKQSKAVVATIKGTDKSAIYYSIAEASRVLGIDSKNIIYCCQRKPKYKTAGGYTWRYLNHQIKLEEAKND